MIGDDVGQIKVFTNMEGSNDLTRIKSFFAHTGESSRVNRIKQSPFVESSQYVATSSNDVKIWDTSANWTLIGDYSHGLWVYAMDWIDKDSIASCGAFESQIQIWNIYTGVIINQNINFNDDDIVITLKLLTNKIHLALGFYSGDIIIYAISDGSQVGQTLQGHSNIIYDFVQLDAFTLASSSEDSSVRIWDLQNYTSKFNLKGHSDRAFGLKQVSSSILASGSWDFTIKLWNTTTGTVIRTLSSHTDKIRWNVDLLNNGRTLISGSLDKSIKLWNWSSGECLSTTQTGSRIRSLIVLSSSSSYSTSSISTEITTESISLRTPPPNQSHKHRQLNQRRRRQRTQRRCLGPRRRSLGQRRRRLWQRRRCRGRRHRV